MAEEKKVPEAKEPDDLDQALDHVLRAAGFLKPDASDAQTQQSTQQTEANTGNGEDDEVRLTRRGLAELLESVVARTQRPQAKVEEKEPDYLEGLDEGSKKLVNVLAKVVDAKMAPLQRDLKDRENKAYMSKVSEYLDEHAKASGVPVLHLQRYVYALIVENGGEPVSMSKLKDEVGKIAPVSRSTRELPKEKLERLRTADPADLAARLAARLNGTDNAGARSTGSGGGAAPGGLGGGEGKQKQDGERKPLADRLGSRLAALGVKVE